MAVSDNRGSVISGDEFIEKFDILKVDVDKLEAEAAENGLLGGANNKHRSRYFSSCHMSAFTRSCLSRLFVYHVFCSRTTCMMVSIYPSLSPI